jgi:hypothetical protein
VFDEPADVLFDLERRQMLVEVGAELHQKRVGLATKRHAVEEVLRAAQAVIDGADERRRAVLVIEARGDEPSESVEKVDGERRVAEVALADARQRAEALRTVEREIGDEVDAVIDRNPEHFEQKAAEANEEAQRLTRAAADAVQAAEAGYRAAGAASGVVWRSCKRRRVEDGPREWPANDLGRATSAISAALHLLQLLKARPKKSPTVPQASNSEPPLELVGGDAA